MGEGPGGDGIRRGVEGFRKVSQVMSGAGLTELLKQGFI